MTYTLWNIVLFLIGKDGRFMIAMLWANQIMMDKKTFAQVPRLLKDKVRELLIDAGCEDLIVE